MRIPGLVLALLFVNLLSFSSTHASTRTWSKALSTVEARYLTLHGEDDAWSVELTAEARGSLPELVWRRSFPREAEALRYALSVSSKGLFEARALRALPFADGTPSTEVPGVSIWQVT